MENETDQPGTAVAIREPLSLAPTADAPQPMTAAQGKVDAVAKLTMDAYQRASQLQLTDTEITGLLAEFPDEAFKPGAAGKENLLYIEHAFLRDRLNSVFRPGQWAIVPRNRWAEPFTTSKGTEGSRVYVEAMLCIRGCFAAEAVGEMEYYPSNGSQNYGDCVEGAKTAALRRCCKEIGIGLQAWKKDWCEGWWQRRRSGGSRPAAAPSRPAVPAPTAAPAAKPSTTKAPILPTADSLAKMVTTLDGISEMALEFMQKVGWLMPTETLSDLPLFYVPATLAQMNRLQDAIADFGNGADAVAPYPAHDMPFTKTAKAKPISVPRDEHTDPNSPDAAWRSFPMPWGTNAGVKLADLDKKYLYGLWANYTVETEYQGRPKKPETIAKDKQFRACLDEAGKHYEFTKD